MTRTKLTKRTKVVLVFCLGILAVALHLKVIRSHYDMASDSRARYELALKATVAHDSLAGIAGNLSDSQRDSLRIEAEGARKRLDEKLYAGSFRVLFFFVAFPWIAILFKPKFVAWWTARNKRKA